MAFVDQLVLDVGLEEAHAKAFRHMSHFLSHIALQHWDTCCDVLPSQLACCVIYYAGCTLGHFDGWPDALTRKSVKVPKSVSSRLLPALHALYTSLPNSDLHRAIRSKYSHFSLLSVALTRPLKQCPL